MAIRKENQHYVPQFYLKQFANFKKKSYYVETYDISQKRSFTTNTENIAAEINYNDVIIDDNFLSNTGKKLASKYSGNPFLTYENAFTHIETKSAPILNNLIENMKITTLKDKTILSAFWGSLLLRVPAFRNLIETATEITKNHFSQKLRPEILELISNFDKNQLKYSTLDVSFNLLESVSYMLFTKKWSIGMSKFGAWIHSSDNPVITVNTDNINDSLTLSSPRTFILIPLNRYMFLQMTDDRFYPNIPDVFYFDHEDARTINHLIRSRATRYLFAQNRDDFSEVNESPLGDNRNSILFNAIQSHLI